MEISIHIEFLWNEVESTGNTGRSKMQQQMQIPLLNHRAGAHEDGNKSQSVIMSLGPAGQEEQVLDLRV